MPDWSAFLSPRLAALRLSPAREAEIIEEMSHHLEERYEELRRDGRSDPDARGLAVEELLEPHALAERMRPLRQSHVPAPITPGGANRFVLGDLWPDLRYALRMLRKQPGFAAAAILTLALGIGANSAVFSLINATLSQRLPVQDPDRLVYVNRGGGGVFAYPAYAHLRDANQVFDGFAAWGGILASLNAGQTAELVSGFIVTGNFFDVLGIHAAQGRLLSMADDVTPGAHPVAVISHDFWRTRFGGSS